MRVSLKTSHVVLLLVNVGLEFKVTVSLSSTIARIGVCGGGLINSHDKGEFASLALAQ